MATFKITPSLRANNYGIVVPYDSCGNCNYIYCHEYPNINRTGGCKLTGDIVLIGGICDKFEIFKGGYQEEKVV